MEFEELKRVFLEQADNEGGGFLLSLVNVGCRRRDLE
jgi:hypothetical protein